MESIREPRLFELVRNVFTDVEKLLRKEVALIRAEIHEEFDKRETANVRKVTSFVFLFLGLVLIARGLVSFLINVTKLPEWTSFGMTAAVFLLVGGILFLSRKKDLIEEEYPTGNVTKFSVYSKETYHEK